MLIKDVLEVLRTHNDMPVVVLEGRGFDCELEELAYISGDRPIVHISYFTPFTYAPQPMTASGLLKRLSSFCENAGVVEDACIGLHGPHVRFTEKAGKQLFWRLR